jgi:hypothetical protein
MRCSMVSAETDVAINPNASAVTILRMTAPNTIIVRREATKQSMY